MREEEYLRKIIEYLRGNIKKGYTIESLRWALVGQGYSRTSVERGIDEFNKELARQAPILKEKPTIKYEVVDENDNPIKMARSWWKKFFRF